MCRIQSERELCPQERSFKTVYRIDSLIRLARGARICLLCLSRVAWVLLGAISSIRFLRKRRSWNITNLDAESYGANPENLADIRNIEHYRFLKADLADDEVVERFVREVDLIVHFAAETHVDRSISDPAAFLRSNVQGTFALLEAARKSNVRKFIHISTDEVYGSAPLGKTYAERDRLEASSPYSASKAAADMFVQAYHKTYGLNTVILRCTNNYGPYQFPEKFIPKTIISSLLGRRIPIYGDGGQIRDWIHVRGFLQCSRICHRQRRCRKLIQCLRGKRGLQYRGGQANPRTSKQTHKSLGVRCG